MNPQILIDYIETNGLDKLAENKKIVVKPHPKYSNLIMLKYNQIESDFTDSIVRLCRGIILDKDNNWKPVCYTYKKFANYGEGYADKVDFADAKYYEKVDGSLIQMFWYDNAWQISTSGSPDAGGNVGKFSMTFAELFWQVWKELDYQFPDDTNCCFAFELMTKYNKVVITHSNPRIVLHGGRNLKTFKELNPIVEAYNYKWECVKVVPFDSLDAMLAATKSMSGMEQEGFVACDSQYRRVKLKCADYICLAHLRDSCGASSRQLLDLVRNNEGSEFLTAFEEYRNDYAEIRYKFERLIGQVEGFYEAIKYIENRKEFALKATTQKFSGLLFMMKFGQKSFLADGTSTITLPTSFRIGLSEMNIKLLEEWLGMKSEKQEE